MHDNIYFYLLILHREKNDRNLLETHVKRSNIQKSVIQDEITRKPNEDSEILQANQLCLTNFINKYSDLESQIKPY